MRQGLWKNGIIYLLLLVAGVALISMLLPTSRDTEKVPLNVFLEEARQGNIRTIEQEGNTLTAIPKDPEARRLKTSFMGSTWELYNMLKEEDIDIGTGGIELVTKEPSRFNWGSIFTTFLPLLFLGFILFLFLNRAQGANSQAFNFARSRARLIMGNRPNVTFADVAGVDEAKQELQEVVEFLKNPAKFHALGARIPHGVLLVGPPGTGKTLLAKAVAGEAGVPFFSISGSEFVEMFVGVGASRVRDLFDQAKRNAPCIIFVDEIDAVGRHRGAGLGGGHDEREQTLNQILVEMDGFDSNTNIIVLSATNRPDILDPALLRPGRFDRQVVLDRPDIKGRKAILEVHTRNKPLEADVNLEKIAMETPGFTGADLANLVNEAAILAARRNKRSIGMKEFEDAIDKVIAGPEKKGRVISPKEKKIIAYHEAGHALVAKFLPEADPVHKISIVTRGVMGGYTRFLPSEDRHLWTRSQFYVHLAVLLGGRAAEEVALHDISTGASDDLERATKLAREMVTRYGMSEGPDYEELPINVVMQEVLAGTVDVIEVYGNDLLVRMKDGRVFRSRKEEDFSLVEYLEEQRQQGRLREVDGLRIYVKDTDMLGGLGPRTFGRREELVFLGKEIAEQRNYGDKVADKIDEEVHNLINKAYSTAKEILSRNRVRLEYIARKLIEKETLEGEELEELFTAPLSEEVPA